MSEIKMRDPGVGVTYVPRAQSKTIGGLDAAAAESTVSLFRVVVVVHGINSEWNETFAINPEYPSFQVCEAARDELVEDFLYILKRRYLQPFNVDSRCVKSDGEV